MKAGVARFAAGFIVAMLVVGCSQSSEIARLTAEAVQAEARGDHAKAIDCWTSVLRLNRKNPEARLKRAALYEATGQWKKAAGDYTEYLHLPTNHPSMSERLGLQPIEGWAHEDDRVGPAWILCRRGFAYAKAGAFDKAFGDLNEAARLNPNNPTTHICRGQAFEMQGDHEKAINCCTKAIQAAPSDAAGYMYRGFLYSRRGRFEEAIADLDHALEIEPQNAEALMRRGIAYGTHGRLERALEDLNAAAEVSQDNPEIYAARGAIFLDLGNFDDAFRDFNHTLLFRPNDPFALARRGLALTKKGDLELALGDLNEAIRLNPAEAFFYAWRGAAHSQTNQLAQALEDLNLAIQLNPNEAGFYSSRGVIFNKQKEYEKAAAEFKKTMLVNPGSPEGYNSLAWFRATCPEDSFRDGKEAIKLATKAGELTSFKIHSVLDTLAACYAEMGDFEQAIAYEKQSLDIASATYKNRPAMEARLALYQQRKPFRETPQK